MKTTWRKAILCGTECLVPCDDDAVAWLGKTKLGQDVLIEPKRPRNVAHHRKLFALIKLAVRNWPEDQGVITEQALLGAIKISLGHCETVTTKKGQWQIPKSINFESMGQDEFNPFYDGAMEIISRVLGCPVEILDQEARAA